MHSEVSVIVPCYNVERYLKRALDSVFAQTYNNFRVYPVDDGSTDGTLRVLETYADRCCFVSQPHAGPAAVRNRAIQMSGSPFVAFLDADDEWLPEKLERQIPLLKQDPTLGLVCSLCAIHEAGSDTSPTFTTGDVPGPGRLFEQSVREGFVHTPTVVVRRRCLDDVGLFNESLAVSEDRNLWLRIAARWRIAFLPEVLAIVHKRPGSLSVSIPVEERLRNGVAALEHVESSCPELSAAEARALRMALAERLYCYGSFLLSSGVKEASRGKLASTLTLQPTHWRAFAKLVLSFLPTQAYDFLAALKTKPAGVSPSKSNPTMLAEK